MKKVWLDWILDHPVPVIVLSLTVVAVAISGIRQTVFVSDYEVYFPDGNAHLEAYHKIEDTYSKFDNIAFVITAKDGTVFDPKTLDAINRLTLAAWQLPFSRRVDSLTNFQHIEAEADSLYVESLFESPLEYTPRQIEMKSAIALHEPRLKPILSHDGQVTSVNVAVNLPGESADETTPVVEAAMELAREYRSKYPDIDIRLTGSVVINYAYFTYLQSDLATLMPIVLGIIFLIIWFLFGSFLVSLAVMTCSVLAVLASFGISAYLGFVITNAAINVPTILLAVTVASGVHVCAAMIRRFNATRDGREAIRYSLEENFQPVTLTCATTMIGFLCLNFGDLPPYGWMGSVAAIGVGVSYLVVMVMLPAILRLLPLYRPRVFAPGVMDRLGPYVVKERQRIFSLTVIMTVIAFACLTRNEFNDSFVEYLDEDLIERQDAEYAMEELGGLYTLSYSLRADESVADPEYLAKVDRFVAWLEHQPEIAWVSSIVPTVKELNKAMNGGDKNRYVVPGDAELTAQYLLIYELSLPYGLDMTTDIDIDRRESKVVVAFGNVTNKVLREVDQRITGWLRDNVPEFTETGAGPSIMFAYLWSSAAKSTFFGLLVAIFAIAAIAAVAFRDIQLGAITILPNLIPPLAAYGVWGLIDGWLDVGATNVATLTFGIVVDDTIHLLARYRRKRQRGGTPSEAVIFSLNEVGSALLFTTTIISFGFLALVFGQFDTNQTIGALSFLVLWVALLFDLFFLPALLVTFYGGRGRKPEIVPTPEMGINPQ